jgi:tetraacyldisaccharide 4'-kinase
MSSPGSEGTLRRDRFVADVMHGADRGMGATLLRSLLLAPLAGLHTIGLETYLLPYRTGVRKRFRLPVPVIAIGNLSSGGTGKTPMALLVADHLRAAGRRVALLSRGHGGSGEQGRGGRIVSDGEHVLLSASEAGDEPTLLANRLPGVPVVVGRDRRRSGRLAVERFDPEIVLLDDGLQYWQLHRDLDIVLLDAARPFDNGYVLPRGLLREPPGHLARAGAIVLTRADRAPPTVVQENIDRIRRLAPNAAVFTASHRPVGWVRGNEAAALPADALSGRRAFAFSGIADGAAFVDSARGLGVDVTGRRDFGDHHPYDVGEIADLVSTACGGIAVTTEKDLVKVGALWPADGPELYALRIGMHIDDEPRFWRRLAEVIPLEPEPASQG